MTEPDEAAAATPISRRRVLAGAAAATALGTIGATFGPVGAVANLAGLIRQRSRPLPSVDVLERIDVASYPSLSAHELGMLHYQHRKATASLGDWSLWEPSMLFGERRAADGQEGEGTQFDVLYCAAAVSHAVEKTPAYREFAEVVLGGIAEKAIDDRCWRYWTENADRSGNDGSYLPYTPDPIKLGNAMYTGNMAGVLAYYTMMTGDRRYDDPVPFVYRGDGVEIDGVRVEHGQTWWHSWGDVVESVVRQMEDNPSRHVYCQIPTEYFHCNLAIAQSIVAYDAIHGTDNSERILFNAGGFFEKAGETMFVPPRSTGLPVLMIYLMRQSTGRDALDLWVPVPTPFATADVYVVCYLAPVKPDWASDVYAMAKPRWFTPLPDGTGFWRANTGLGGVAQMLGLPLTQDMVDLELPAPMLVGEVVTSGFGALAAAMQGDGAVRAATLRWLDAYAGPTWVDDETLVYKAGYRDPEYYMRSFNQAVFLNARAMDDPTSLRHMQVDARRFEEPTITGVDYPAVKVATATFDREASALVSRFVARRSSRFSVVNLPPGSTARVLLDGRHAEDVVADRRGRVTLSLPAGEHSYVIATQGTVAGESPGVVGVEAAPHGDGGTLEVAPPAEAVDRMPTGTG